MALILNIDTALDNANITLAEDGGVVSSRFNESQKDHTAWLQPAIQNLMTEASVGMQQLNAVGINIGPGSYTGLRIGLSAAKGICYALSIPLITEVSLKLLAFSAIHYANNSKSEQFPPRILFCPMIDARRMEVFAAIYDHALQVIMEPRSMILDRNSFEDQLKRQKMLFLGNATIKFRQVCQNQQAIFKEIPLNPIALATLTYANFIGNNFAELAYTEPLYLKEFFTRQTGHR